MSEPAEPTRPAADPPSADLVAVVASLLEADPAQREALLARLSPREAELARSRLDSIHSMGLSLDEPVAVLGPPRRIGRFTRIERVGAGGMGEVHFARDEATGEPAAIKLLRPEHLWFEAAHERFRRELQALAPLAHPGIVRVLEVGQEHGIPWLALEWVGGISLDRVLGRLGGWPPDALTPSVFRETVLELSAGVPHAEPVSPDAFPGETYVEVVARIVLRVAEALANAHAAGVLHRDVKSANVLVTPSGRILLTDFGLALPSGADRVTRAGSWLGSLPYAAPEQLAGNEGVVDVRADVYSLGALLYELLTLRTPFLGGAELDVRRRIASGDLERPRRMNHAVPSALEAVCLSAIDPDAARRPAGAAELAGELELALAGKPVRARAPGPFLRARRWVRRHPGRASSITGAGLLVALLAVFSAREVDVARRIGRLVEAELVRGLLEESNAFWPADAGREHAMVDWLRRAEEIRRSRNLHEAEFEALVERAVPSTPEEHHRARATSLEQLGTMMREMDALRSYVARTGKGVLPAPPDPESVAARDLEIRALLAGSPEECERALKAEIESLRTAAAADPGPWAHDLDQIDSFEALAEELVSELRAPPPPRFEAALDAWQALALRRLLEDFDRLGDLSERVERQLAEVRRLAGLARGTGEGAWPRAMSAIEASHRYRGLRVEPVFGLVPLGENPVSGLWEFLVATSGDAPVRDSTAPGGERVEAGTGIVLVLVPGGRFEMGQPDGTGRVLEAARPVHPVELDPYLISKFELTRGQAARLGYVSPMHMQTAAESEPVPISWHAAYALFRRHGLELPTEAQWEHAARCGEAAGWPIEGCANLADRALADAWRIQGFGAGRAIESFEDGYVAVAPAGSFRPNGFGLHDTLGNLAEWCMDPFVYRGYSSLIARPGDGLRDTALGLGDRVVRGGNFLVSPDRASVWTRDRDNPGKLVETHGVRPAMRVRAR